MFGFSLKPTIDLEDSYNGYMELLRELADKQQEVTMLRGESGIAREAIQRYCPPELTSSADRWLRDKGL